VKVTKLLEQEESLSNCWSFIVLSSMELSNFLSLKENFFVATSEGQTLSSYLFAFLFGMFL
jgi:hypothetical protein